MCRDAKALHDQALVQKKLNDCVWHWRLGVLAPPDLVLDVDFYYLN